MGDRCTGQNCNRMVFVALFLALHWFGFKEIHLHFLSTGHSYSENDNCHAMIERGARSTTVFTTDQWEAIIMTSLTKNNREVKVHRMESNKFLNMKYGPHLSIFKNIMQRETYYANDETAEQQAESEDSQHETQTSSAFTCKRETAAISK